MQNDIDRRRRKIRAAFVDDEAELSDDVIVSSDEDERDVVDDEMLRFVNDATQLTQHVANAERAPDEQAMYLQSMKRRACDDSRNVAETENLAGRFKLAYGVGRDIDVFSQAVEPDVSDYLEDSFVAGNEEQIEEEEGEDEDEISLLQSATQIVREEKEHGRLRTRREVRQGTAGGRKLVKEKAEKTKRKRIVICDDDTSATSADCSSMTISPEATARERASTSAVDSWTCKWCTFVNSGSDVCDICGHDVTQPKRHDVTTSTRHDVTTSKQHDAISSKRHDVTTPKRHSDITSKQHDVIGSKRHDVITPKRHDVIIPNRHDVIAPKTRDAVASKAHALTTASKRGVAAKNNDVAKSNSRDVTAPTTSDVSDHVRRCEICSCVLTTKGWMCPRCIQVMKSSEKNFSARNSGSSFLDTRDPSHEETTPRSSKHEPTQTMSREERLQLSRQKQKELRAKLMMPRGSAREPQREMTREERLKISRQKQLELRAKLKQRKPGDSCDADSAMTSSSSVTSSPSVTSSRGIQVTAASTHSANKSTGSPFDSSFNFDNSTDVMTSSPPVMSLSQEPPMTQGSDAWNQRGKLVILVDTREVSSGATSLVQRLRMQHDVTAVVASLQCCGFAVGCRSAVVRKSVSDISTTGVRQRLADQLRRAHQRYPTVYLIVEKDRVKTGGKGWKGGEPSASCRSHFVSTVVALAGGPTRVLYSDNQEESADLLHELACRERRSRCDVDANLVEKLSSARVLNLVKIYTSVPGVSFVTALFLAARFASLQHAADSSIEQLVAKAHLTREAAENLFYAFRKVFDIQMTSSK